MAGMNLTKKQRIDLGYFVVRDSPDRPGEVELLYKCRWAGTGGHCNRLEPADRIKTLQSHESYSQSKRLKGQTMDECPGERLD